RRAGVAGVRARGRRVRLPGRVAGAREALRAWRGRVARDVDPRGERERDGGGAEARVTGAARRRLYHVQDAGRERLERGRARDRQRRAEVAVRVEGAGARGTATVPVDAARRERVVVHAVLARTGTHETGIRIPGGAADQVR